MHNIQVQCHYLDWIARAFPLLEYLGLETRPLFYVADRRRLSVTILDYYNKN
jgi:hypothetical protein